LLVLLFYDNNKNNNNMYLNCQELVQFHHLSYKLKKNLQLFIRPFHRVPLVGAFFAFNFLQWTSNQPLIEKTLSDVLCTIADFSKLFSSDIISQFEHKSNHWTLLWWPPICAVGHKKGSLVCALFSVIFADFYYYWQNWWKEPNMAAGAVSARVSQTCDFLVKLPAFQTSLGPNRGLVPPAAPVFHSRIDRDSLLCVLCVLSLLYSAHGWPQ